MKETYEKYAELDAQIKQLTEERDALKPQIMEKMTESGEDKIRTEVGSFTLTKLKKWEYPVEVANKEADYKIAKSNAETDGTATFTETLSMRFTATK